MKKGLIATLVILAIVVIAGVWFYLHNVRSAAASSTVTSTEAPAVTNAPPAPEAPPADTNAATATTNAASSEPAAEPTPASTASTDTNAVLAATNAAPAIVNVSKEIGAFTNPSFETPALGDYSYTPEESGWAFTNNAGITKTGTGTAYGATDAPDGGQVALLQGAGGKLGSMSQTINFPAGTYAISFKAAQRTDQSQPILISVDEKAVGTYTPESSDFAVITTAAFTVTAGNHTVTFAATDDTADKTSFVDTVSIKPASASTSATPGATNAAPTAPSADGAAASSETKAPATTAPASGN